MLNELELRVSFIEIILIDLKINAGNFGVKVYYRPSSLTAGIGCRGAEAKLSYNVPMIRLHFVSV